MTPQDLYTVFRQALSDWSADEESKALASTAVDSRNRQNIRAFPLVNTAAFSDQTVLPLVGAPGNSIAYLPAGSNFTVRVEVAFDINAGQAMQFVELQPGMRLHLGKTAFSAAIIRITRLFGTTSIAAGTFLGTLVVATDYDQTSVGATPDTGIWVRTTPSALSFFTRTLAANGAATGIFAFVDTMPGVIDGQNYKIVCDIENNGNDDLYLGSQTLITADSVGNRLIVRKLGVGQRLSFTRSGIPPKFPATVVTVTDVVFVYSASNTSYTLTLQISA